MCPSLKLANLSQKISYMLSVSTVPLWGASERDAALESASSVIVFLKALHFLISQPVGSACNGTSSRSYIHVYIPNST